MTAPERLARHDGQHRRLIDDLAPRGGPVACVERPMRQDPHDPLRLPSRGAVAEYERTRSTARMRRGRPATWRRGQLWPWSVPPDGSGMDPERPRAPPRRRLEPVTSAVLTPIWAWSPDPCTPAPRSRVAQRLTDDPIPTLRGGPRGHGAAGRGLLRAPLAAGPASSARTRPGPARRRPSAWRPGGPGPSHRPAPPEAGLAMPGPASLSAETGAAAQAPWARKTLMARRHTTPQAS
jgi:hypothetical protein